jgi:gas vesicle protein
MNKMKLFKKVLAVVLVGAMAVSMLTACGSSKQTKAVNKVGKGNALVAETSDAMASLQKMSATANVTDSDVTAYYKALAKGNGQSEAEKALVKTMNDKLDAARTEIAQNLSQFTCAKADSSSATYDLYIWTNAAENPTTHAHYAYLMKVNYNDHIKGSRLALLVSPGFVELGEFKGTDLDYAILKDVLKDAGDQVGISISKVYGKDVLLVAVPKGKPVSDFGKTART